MTEERTIDEIVAAVEEAGGLLLLLVGFDGVLVDYLGDPQTVRLSRARCASLSALARGSHVALGLVSGRRIRDLKQCATLGDRVYYVGLHGLEVEGPGVAVTRRDVIDDCRDQVHEIAATVEPSVSSLPGVRIEDKEAAIAVHTREASSGDAVWARLHLLSTAAAVAGHDALRVLRGNHVIELLPNVPSPRAAAIGRIRQHLGEQTGGPVFTVYIGEDVPHDEAFDAVVDRGISAAVGARARQARFHLSSTSDVWTLIDRLAAGTEAVSPGP